MKKINLKNILMSILALLVIFQFFRIDKVNPASPEENDFLNIVQATPEIKQLVTNACYDCHSHHTEYPWYTQVAPLSWWIKGHINEGRKHLNFSMWNTYNQKKSNHKIEECYEEIENGNMPMSSFTWTHPEAKLSDEQKDMLISFFKNLYDPAIK